jgi:aldehyde dehydrogenase (NAD+)
VINYSRSELAQHTATLLAALFPKYLDATCFTIVRGDKMVAQTLLKYRFGHILYTGSTGVGREVMSMAGQHLTPVTLKLGGRNSVVATANANIELTAMRIAWS